MLDIKLVREHPEQFKRAYQRMKRPELLQKLNDLVEKDISLRSLKGDLDTLRGQRNVLSQEINTLRKAGKNTDAVLKKVKALPEEIKKTEEEYVVLESEVHGLLHTLPNLIHDKVPYGASDKDNVEIKKWGKIPKFLFPVKNHVEILEALGAVDFDASAKSTGAGFYYLKGDFALLNQALIRFTIDHMVRKGFSYVEPPLMLRKEILFAALDKAAFEQSIYTIDGGDTCLIGTSEFSLLGMHAGEVLKELPKKYFSYTMCFRKEIGAHGINEKGLWRTHQFNKVEQFIFCTKEDSWKWYDLLLQNTEEIFQALELPYRVIEICTGDLAIWKARSADIEVWRPTTQGYGEVASLSNCTDYQARTLNIKYETVDGREVVSTLNNTAIATSRALVGIVENYQQKDGTILVPKALQAYMGGKKIIGKSN
ncbi:serine--tRNA ligase [Candidatus Woesearchaeota archaeon]|nr:serine--tRNA ligase [Candidatus Woesearchaeota archaeon]